MPESCPICFRHCTPPEGELGACRGRRMVNGHVICDNYGKLTAITLDPIEKKPLRQFCPGSKILSVGSYGCNLSCPFCENHNLSQAKPGDVYTMHFTPEEVVERAVSLQDKGNIGVAFTYNEPMISMEFVRDTAMLAKQNGLKTVLVTNGTAEVDVLEELLPYIDAMNVDFKGFDYYYYKKTLGGDINIVIRFIERAVQSCHVEITTLVVPNENDNETTIRMISAWIASLNQKYHQEIPLHISRFFPAYKMLDKYPTNMLIIDKLCEIAREKLKYVYKTSFKR